MLSLKPPKTKYTSLEDAGKFEMIWNVSIVLVPIFALLVIIHLFFQDASWKTSLGAGLTALLNIIVLQKIRTYKLIGVLSVILGILICQTSIFIINDSHLIADVMWCVLIAFFTYFLFGSLIGTLVLLFNLTGIVVFLLNGSRHDVLTKGIAIEHVDFRMVINVYYVAFALAFIIYKIVENNRSVGEKYEKEIARNELLLKEIHHRVKNNLQIISSLLKLQAAESSNSKVEEHFNEAISRIRAMSLIHEKMYSNNDLAQIDIKSYLISLTQDILKSIQSETNIEFNIESQIEKIDVKSVVPISLIFNELITNSLKHGFNNQKNGKIDVEIINQQEVILFKYHDNGVWRIPENDATFGLELIRTLTDQLEGKFSRTINAGTHYALEFNSKPFFFLEEL